MTGINAGKVGQSETDAARFPLMRSLRTNIRGTREGAWRLWLSSRGIWCQCTVHVHGLPRISIADGSSVTVGDNVVLNSSWRSDSLHAPWPWTIRTLTPAARIYIGANSGLSSVVLSSACWITIGERVLVGAGAIITDSVHHDLTVPAGDRRYAGFPGPQPDDGVYIEDDAFIGTSVVILSGVRVGRGAVVGAGSIVTKNIEPDTFAAGNPCRAIRQLDPALPSGKS